MNIQRIAPSITSRISNKQNNSTNANSISTPMMTKDPSFGLIRIDSGTRSTFPKVAEQIDECPELRKAAERVRILIDYPCPGLRVREAVQKKNYLADEEFTGINQYIEIYPSAASTLTFEMLKDMIMYVVNNAIAGF